MIANKDKTRFLSKIKKAKNCWIWKEAKDKDGYGLFYLKSKLILAHRMSFIIFKGEIPNGLFVCHTCDNPSCVKPEHLWVGTNKDNLKDMMIKGRQGKTIFKSILDKGKVIEIRNFYKQGLSQSKIAEKYGITQSGVSRIINKNRWNWFEPAV